jgi:hypothetical protein
MGWMALITGFAFFIRVEYAAVVFLLFFGLKELQLEASAQSGPGCSCLEIGQPPAVRARSEKWEPVFGKIERKNKKLERDSRSKPTVHDSYPEVSFRFDICPGAQGEFTGGLEGRSQGIEADAKPGFFATAMGFSEDGLTPHSLCGASIGPAGGQGQDAQEGGQFLRVGDPGVFQVQATVQERPHQGRPKPPGHHRQNQNIDLLGSDAPVRSIERQGDWPIASSASG